MQKESELEDLRVRASELEHEFLEARSLSSSVLAKQQSHFQHVLTVRSLESAILGLHAFTVGIALTSWRHVVLSTVTRQRSLSRLVALTIGEQQGLWGCD